jgi:hypothetical protein
MNDNQLNRFLASKLIHIQPISRFNPASLRIRPNFSINIESNAIHLNTSTLAFQNQLEVPLTYNALLDDLEHTMKHRFWKVLSPRPRMLERTGNV